MFGGKINAGPLGLTHRQIDFMASFRTTHEDPPRNPKDLKNTCKSVGQNQHTLVDLSDDKSFLGSRI